MEEVRRRRAPSETGGGTPRTTPGVLLLYPLASVCEEGGDEREGAGPARPPVAIAVGRAGPARRKNCLLKLGVVRI